MTVSANKGMSFVSGNLNPNGPSKSKGAKGSPLRVSKRSPEASKKVNVTRGSKSSKGSGYTG